MLSGGEVARLQQSSQCVSGVSDTFSYANAVRHAMALKMSRSVRDMGHSRTHTQPLAIKDTQRPSLRCVARAPNGHSGPLHSSMTLPVTLVNKHQPLRLASRATSPFNALGNKNPSITLESIPHLETQSHSYVHVVGFLSHHFQNTHTPSCPCPCPCPSFPCTSPQSHRGLACGTHLVLFCSHSVTHAFVPFRLFRAICTTCSSIVERSLRANH